MSDQFNPDCHADAQRRTVLRTMATLPWLGIFTKPANASIELEGVSVSETAEVGGKKLILNGLAVRRRGALKPDLAALYLPERHTTPESVFRLDGPRRLQFNILRELSSATLSRIFVADFKQMATDEEFKKLITVIGQIGQAYGNLKSLSRGDVVNLDWVPGSGWTVTLNNKPFFVEPGLPLGSKDELAYQIYLRMNIGPNAPEDLRNGLMGRDRSSYGK